MSNRLVKSMRSDRNKFFKSDRNRSVTFVRVLKKQIHDNATISFSDY